MTFEPYNPNLWPLGQKLVPSRSLQVAGLPTVLSDFLSQWIRYQPDPNFNTEYLGLEEFNYVVNDQCNFNPAIAAGAACISPNIENFAYVVKVHAVNNHPQVILEFPFFNVTEDHNHSVNGITVDDVDVNEIPCTVEPCSSGKGVLQVRIATSNGTIQVSDSFVSKTTLFETFLESAFGIVDNILTNRDERMCIMQLSCRPNSKFLTLASDTVQTICEASGVDSIRCKEVLQYCTTASLALNQYSSDECISILSNADIYKVRCTYHL